MTERLPFDDKPLEELLPREHRLKAEVERQRKIYRVGTADVILQRAALLALQERGEW